MKTFKDYLTENHNESIDIMNLLNESHDFTEEQEAAIDSTVDRILEAQKEGKNLEDCVEEIINEGRSASEQDITAMLDELETNHPGIYRVIYGEPSDAIVPINKEMADLYLDL